MWLSLAVVALVVAPQAIQGFRNRHEPESPNGRLKLPTTLLLLVASLVLIAFGVSPVLCATFAAIAVIQLGLVLVGRNPWWMQARYERRQYERYEAGLPRDLDPSA